MKHLLPALALLVALDKPAAQPETKHYNIDEKVRQTTEILLERKRLKVDVYASFYGTHSVLMADLPKIQAEDEKFAYLFVSESGDLDFAFTWASYIDYGLELKKVLIPKENINGNKLEDMMQLLAGGNAKKITDDWGLFDMIYIDNICDDLRTKFSRVQRQISKNYDYLKENYIKTEDGFMLTMDDKLKVQLSEDDAYLDSLILETNEKYIKPKKQN